jgi:glycosyltransferase involved in cell wall biosynthesis
MSQLTVVLLIDELRVWGGTETHLLRLLTRLDPARIRPVLATVGASDLAGELRLQRLQVEPLEIHRTFAPSGLIGLGKIARLLRRERASLLLTYHTAADLLGPLPARAIGVPVLSCRRDDGFTKKALHVRIQRGVNRIVTGMIAVSRSVAATVERDEGYPGERIQVIWNGEDLSRFTPGPSRVREELGLPPEACLAITVGSLTPVKDHRSQLAAFARAAVAEPRLRLLVVGDGPLRAELEAEALRQLPDPGRIRFLGHRKDIPELLRASDLYLQTSLTEGFSNAILQAMASGLPVIATAVGGNPELVTADCGRLVPAREVSAIEGAILELARSPERRRALGLAARARSEAAGSLEAMVAAYTDAFERAVAGCFPGPSSC